MSLKFSMGVEIDGRENHIIEELTKDSRQALLFKASKEVTYLLMDVPLFSLSSLFLSRINCQYFTNVACFPRFQHARKNQIYSW